MKQNFKLKSSAMRATKFLVSAALTAVVGILAPQTVQQRVDQLWVEETHQALLMSLVIARHYAWDNGVTARLCLADERQRCVAVDGDSAGWRAYVISGGGDTQTISFQRFRTSNVALTANIGKNFEASLGFDSNGYSLSTGIIYIDIYSLSGFSEKTYTVIVESNGMLHTMVKAETRDYIQMTLAGSRDREKILGAAL